MIQEDDVIRRAKRLVERYDKMRIVGGGGEWSGNARQGFAFNPKPIAGGSTPTPVVGACCIGSECHILTEANCIAAGGTYRGDGSTCTPNPCDNPGVCCGGGLDCVDLGACDNSITEEACIAKGGTWIPNGSCDPNPCGCDSTLAPTHIDVSMTITGSVTINCSPFSCSSSWNCSYHNSKDFDPCSPTALFVSGSDVCITCPDHCHTSDTCTPDSSASLAITATETGLGFGTPFAFIVCHCEIDVGYATTLGPAYRPTFAQSWCGWPQAKGTYNLSDTVTWNVSCPSTVGTGSATWTLIITIS